MRYTGTVLPVGELLKQSLAAPEPDWPALVKNPTVEHTAASNARYVARLLADGEPLTAAWQFGILQTLDDYLSAMRLGGHDLAVQVFADTPPTTGAAEIDAAFAALAEYVAEGDEWQPPAWVHDASRRANGWYAAVPPSLRTEADESTPRAFRDRGIWITSQSLDRA